MNGLFRRWRFCVCISLLAAAIANNHAFSLYYNSTGKALRWDLTYTGMDPGVFNFTTKAIKIWIGTNTWSASNGPAELNAIRASFGQWQAISGTAIKFEEAGLATSGIDINLPDKRNLIFFAKSNFVNGGRDNISSKAGYTLVYFDAQNRILEADIALNAAVFSWITDFNNTVSASKFVEAVTTHEIGHFLGLDHTPVGAATVIDGGPGVGPSAGLSPDEIAAARYLYPAAGTLAQLGTITGTVRMGGAGILGAMVTADDSRGNTISATVTDSTGKYLLPALSPGAYSVRVSPLDPSSASVNTSLFRDKDVAPDVGPAVTAFKATENSSVNVTANVATTKNFDVVSGEPAFRIQQISKPTTLQAAPSPVRYGVGIYPGQTLFTGAAGASIPADAILSVSGDGVTVGGMIYEPNRFSGGLHLLQAAVTIASDATPGLRSLVVRRGTDVAYANGYLEVMAPTPDYNFDGLDDRFQRQYFPVWTATEAAPAADPDVDKFSNAFEALTGTDPTNSASNSFLIERVDFTPTRRTITWKSDVGKKYQLYGKADVAGASWATVGSQITATTNSTQVVDPDVTSVNKFYRLKLVP